ncbi:MAG TPA: extensin family protein [Polyangiaceae bacterium]|nr:extensin family protein [Polyangiaceae bacterium]
MNGKVASLLVLAALALGLGGCAHEAPEVSYPQSAGGGWVVPASYSWPPTAVPANGAAMRAPAQRTTALGALAPTPSKSSATAPASIFAKTLGDVPRPRARNELRAVLPGGGDCLARLGERGVRFHTLDHEIGVKTPIVVDGPIANVRYYTGANGPLIADCRLVLALALVGPELVSFGVSDVRFSGAYVFRLSNKGRVSLHAYGLAIDMHGFTRAGVHYEVDHDFRKGLGATVADDAPIANAIAIRFRNSGLFHEYLTPDDNADHHDHVHVGVSPLPDEVL